MQVISSKQKIPFIESVGCFFLKGESQYTGGSANILVKLALSFMFSRFDGDSDY